MFASSPPSTRTSWARGRARSGLPRATSHASSGRRADLARAARRGGAAASGSLERRGRAVSVRVEPFEPLPAARRKAAAEEAERLGAFLDATVSLSCVSGRVLTPRELNRALLARQLLLAREPLRVTHALERVAGLQAQEPRAPYIGLWTRVEGFERAALTDALHRRTVVKATLMRATLHLVSARDYVRFQPGARLVAGRELAQLPARPARSGAAGPPRRGLRDRPADLARAARSPRLRRRALVARDALPPRSSASRRATTGRSGRGRSGWRHGTGSSGRSEPRPTASATCSGGTSAPSGRRRFRTQSA